MVGARCRRPRIGARRCLPTPGPGATIPLHPFPPVDGAEGSEQGAALLENNLTHCVDLTWRGCS
jgi:hypothetical protein